MKKFTITVHHNGLEEPKLLSCYEGETVLDVCHQNDIALAHNCGGVCACSTCHIYITKGATSLPEASDQEEDELDNAWNVKMNSRLACQCKVSAPLHVTIPPQDRIIAHEHD